MTVKLVENGVGTDEEDGMPLGRRAVTAKVGMTSLQPPFPWFS